ncbi:MAG: hypothetical protein QM729_05590 [Solirubrobacterales bacterium]
MESSIVVRPPELAVLWAAPAEERIALLVGSVRDAVGETLDASR